jgi:hypothetical protein
MGTLGASWPRSAKPGFVGRVGTIGNEALEDAFGDFRTFYITFAKIFSTAPAQVRPSRRMSGSPTFIP